MIYEQYRGNNFIIFLNHTGVNFSSLMTINNIILSSLMTMVKERKGEEKKGGREGEEREDWFYTFLKKSVSVLLYWII